MFEFYLILTYLVFLVLLVLNHHHYNGRKCYYINMFNLMLLYTLVYILEYTYLQDILV